MKVLVAPLDWGLGHATRCIPVVREFLRQGAQVELAVVKSNAGLLRETFPELRQHLAPSYNVVYPKHGFNMGAWLLRNSAHLNRVIRYEHRYACEMVRRFGFDILFSDNRFGFYSRAARSIYMTHQRRIAFPKAFSAFESVGEIWHGAVMKHFDEVWVPDLEEAPGYAGTLSHIKREPVPTRFVGPLSRFSGMELPDASKDYGITAVVSGVEPSRSHFEKKLMEILPKLPGRHVMILGKPAAGPKSWIEGNVLFHNHLPSDEFLDTVRRSRWVVSRGGYSTVMDMAVLQSKNIFVPTPGQYEQHILASNLQRAGFAACITEGALSVETMKEALQSNVQPLPYPKNSFLEDAVSGVISA